MSDDTLVQVRRALDGLGVPYEIVEIDPAFADTAAFCEKYGFGLDVSGNTIIVASKKEPKQYAACLVLAHTRLDVNHAVKRLMGASRVSFASAEETMALTGMQIGGVTVLALPPDLPVYVDDRIMALPWMILGAGQPRRQGEGLAAGAPAPARRPGGARPRAADSALGPVAIAQDGTSLAPGAAFA